MAISVNHRSSEAKYWPFENQSTIEEASAGYQPVNIYSINGMTTIESFSVQNKKRLTFRECLCLCFCCKKKYTYVNNQEKYDHPDLPSLSNPSQKNYTLQGDPKPSSYSHIPILTVSRAADDELPNVFAVPKTKAVAKVTINPKQHNTYKEPHVNIVSVPDTSPGTCEFKKVSSASPVKEKSSRKGVLFGENSSFIREVLACRDSFLDSLEWCDNSLTRGKKCRYIKKDDWLNLECDNIEGARTLLP